MKPLRTGLALAVTMAAFCSHCTRIEVAFSERFIGFMNAPFHGMDLRKLAAAQPYEWRWFFHALNVLSLWAFAPGAFFVLLQDALSGRERRAQRSQHE